MLEEVLDTPEKKERARKRDLLRQAAVIREKTKTYFGEILNMNDGKAYVWERHDPICVASKKGQGYEIVKSRTAADEQTHFKQKDGSHVYGDLILMSIDREMHEAFAQLREVKALEAMDPEARMGDMMAFAQGAGMPAERIKEA